MVYGKYPKFVKTAEKQYQDYNKTLELIKKYEKEGRIVVLRPSKDMKVARVEKNLDKLKAIYQLGVDDCLANLEKVKNYLAQ